MEPDPASDEIVPDDPPVDKAEHEPPEILLINPAEGSHPILNHDSLEDKQWRKIPEMESFVDEVSDYEHCIIVQHLTHLQRQDGSLFDDIFDQGVPDAQATEPLQEIVFYDAHEPDLGLPPEDSLTIPTPSGSKILTKCVADDDNLRARMSGGEIPINIDKDRPNIDMSKLAGTLNTAGTDNGTTICGVDLDLPHPPDSMVKPIDGIKNGWLTDGTKPKPPPEPPPPIESSIRYGIIKTRLELAGTPNTASTFYTRTKVDPPPLIFNYENPIGPFFSKLKGILTKWKNGEINNEPLKVIDTDDCAIYAHENDLLGKPDWKHPRTFKQTLGLEKRNESTLWGDTATLKPPQITSPLYQDVLCMAEQMIDALQWIDTIGRFDITTSAMTMSGFHMSHKVGHLNRLRCTYGYPPKIKHVSNRVKTEEGTDFSGSSHPVCGKVEKLLTIDAPEPPGNHATSSHYDNTNLIHDIVMGRLVTGFLHPVNKTPMEWYSNVQTFTSKSKCTIRGESYIVGNNDKI